MPELAAEPVDVARYLAQLADGGLKTATIQRRTAAIRSAHKAAGFEPPTNAEGVKAVMRGIRRRLGNRQVKAAPATAEVLSAALDRLTDSLVNLRPIFREIDRHGRVGQVGLSDRSVSRIVKDVLGAAAAGAFSGHSLRAGFVTSALDAGEDPLKVMKQSRHVNVDTLKGYDRRENSFADHAGEEFL